MSDVSAPSAIAPGPSQKAAARATPRRVTFLINSMEGGGAERAMANLLGHLKGRLEGAAVEIVLLDDLPIQQNLPGWVTVVALDGRGSMLRSAVELLRYFRKNPPTVCVSYLARANCLNVLAKALIGHRALISERVQTSSHLSTARAGAIYRWITRVSYPRADRVIAVSAGVADDLVDNFSVPRAKITVIGNPIDAAALQAAAKEAPAFDLPERFILAVGRMVVNKNFKMLLEGYARARPEADLVILGDGPERAALEAQVQAAGLTGRVHMPGFVTNPYPIMARCECLVSCSNAEGFPNTLIEAITLGCPVIATDCPAGPSEVLRGHAQAGAAVIDNARDGLLIPMGDVDALVDAFQVYASAEARADYAARAQARSAAFGVESVVRDYLSLIDQPGVETPLAERV